MHKFMIITVTALIGLASCQQTEKPSLHGDVFVDYSGFQYGRRDCRRALNNPEIAASFESDKAACIAETNSRIAPETFSESNSRHRAPLNACLEKRGYLWMHGSDHMKRCGA